MAVNNWMARIFLARVSACVFVCRDKEILSLGSFGKIARLFWVGNKEKLLVKGVCFFCFSLRTGTISLFPLLDWPTAVWMILWSLVPFVISWWIWRSQEILLDWLFEAFFFVSRTLERLDCKIYCANLMRHIWPMTLFWKVWNGFGKSFLIPTSSVDHQHTLWSGFGKSFLNPTSSVDHQHLWGW